MNWILFGFKGSGKTYYGSRLGLPFVDTDQLIEEKEELSPREIVLKKGTSYFLNIEKQVIAALSLTGTIIAVGGSTVLDEDNLLLLQKLGKLLYLRCPKTVLKKRILTPPLPSFIDPKNPEESFEKMYCTRKPKYETIPSLWIDLENKSEKEVFKALWQAINLDRSFASPHGAS
nr:Shikimate kinase 2 [Chlamydiota bacterium]